MNTNQYLSTFSTELFGVVAMYLLTFIAAIPLGKYIAKVLGGERTFLDGVLGPMERLFFRMSAIDPQRPMNWKEQLLALLSINLVWFILAMFVLMNMSWLPLNPDGNASMSGHLAFNTAISFVSNTNLQHYSGESGLSYLGQLILMLFQFISAGAGIAICATVFHAMKSAGEEQTSNFFDLFLKSCTRVLLPLAIVVAVLLVFQGVPMTFEGKDRVQTLQGDSVSVSRGPAAAFIAIKQLGTNGGGFFGVNSAHPLENPTYISNAIECMSIALIPIAMVFAMGYMLKKPRLSRMIISVMSVCFMLLLVPTIWSEMSGNSAIAQQGLVQHSGSMEGKEVRLGSVASAYWAIVTTSTSNGSVNSMHDSMTPLSGMYSMLGMMVNCIYGGVGVGFLNFYIFIILAVFISGLMVGRTPEFLGKKIEAREMKIAMLVALLHPFLILVGTAIASSLYSSDPTQYAAWLNNPGYHGFSEMLYEFSSSSANNGSGFEGLGDNVPFWNIACGIVMLLARYIPIIGPVAIAGILASKKHIPESAGTLRADTSVFATVVFAVIFIVAALSFFPVLSLGPVAEHLSMP